MCDTTIIEEGICKIKAITDLLSQVSEDLPLNPETMPWIAIIMRDELDHMEGAVKNISPHIGENVLMRIKSFSA